MQTTIPLYGFGGGSGGSGESDSGGTLTVTAPAGCTVTVSKEDITKTKTADSSGTAVFQGLSSGEWTVTISNGTSTAQTTVSVTADYSAELAFFAATIHITYPAGSTCTAADGVRILSAPDTSGTWDCIVPNTGTWTITIADRERTASNSIEITADGQSESLSISYFSATIHITYPAGSTCTVSDGVTTFTAPDTSGTWDCVVPNAGSWTVTVVDKGWTDTVEITANNQTESLNLDAMYLYLNGSECESITGGWTTSNYTDGTYSGGTLKRNSDNLQIITSDEYQDVYAHTAQKINLSGISQISINVISRSGSANSGGYIGAYLYINADIPNNDIPMDEIACVGISKAGTFSIDVSAITGSYYVVVCCYGASIKFNRVEAIA